MPDGAFWRAVSSCHPTLGAMGFSIILRKVPSLIAELFWLPSKRFPIGILHPLNHCTEALRDIPHHLDLARGGRIRVGVRFS